MRAGTVARVYAVTLLREAERRNAIEAVDADLAGLVETIGREPRLARLLEAPQIAASEKRAFVERTFAGAVDPLTARFLGLVIDKRREGMLGEIAAAWREILEERANRQTATATTAVPLAEAEIEGLRRALERRTGKTITLTHSIDPRLLGGVVVKVGDTVLDGSLRSRLRSLGNRLRTPGGTR